MITLSCQYWIDLILNLHRMLKSQTENCHIKHFHNTTFCKKQFLYLKFSNALLVYLHDRRHQTADFLQYFRFSSNRFQSWWALLIFFFFFYFTLILWSNFVILLLATSFHCRSFCLTHFLTSVCPHFVVMYLWPWILLSKNT